MLRFRLLFVSCALFGVTFALPATTLYTAVSVNPGADEGGCQQTQGYSTASISESACASGFTYSNIYSGTGLSKAMAQFDHLSAYTNQFLVLGNGADGAAGPTGTSSGAVAEYGDGIRITGKVLPSFISMTATMDGSAGPGANGTGVYGQLLLQIGNSDCIAYIYTVAITKSCRVTTSIHGQVSFNEAISAAVDIGVGGT